MSRRARVSVGSLLTIVGGGIFLSTPAPSRAAETLNCRESVREYCNYSAGYCSSGTATCTYEIATCQITNITCNP